MSRVKIFRARHFAFVRLGYQNLSTRENDVQITCRPEICDCLNVGEVSAALCNLNARILARYSQRVSGFWSLGSLRRIANFSLRTPGD